MPKRGIFYLLRFGVRKSVTTFDFSTIRSSVFLSSPFLKGNSQKLTISVYVSSNVLDEIV